MKSKLTVAVATLLTGVAVLGSGTAHAGGERSGVLPITVPEGSTGGGDSTDGWETWQTPTPVSYNVRMLLAQLPVGKPFLGVPWCGSSKGRDGSQQWDWASGVPGSTSIVVAANAPSEIVLYRGSTMGGEFCD